MPKSSESRTDLFVTNDPALFTVKQGAAAINQTVRANLVAVQLTSAVIRAKSIKEVQISRDKVDGIASYQAAEKA